MTGTLRARWSLLAILILIAAPASFIHAGEVALIPHPQAEQVGLKRAWYAQVPLDQARAKIKHINLQAGLLLIVADNGMLHVLDAETGQPQWSFQIGSRKMDSLSASANATHVAVANVARLFVLDRSTGNLLWERQFTGTPERGPALTEHHVMTPLVHGPMEYYSLLEKAEDVLLPQFLSPVGRMIGDPATVDVGVAWAGDQNNLRGHQFGDLGVEFSAAIPGRVGSAPTIFLPNVYIGTEAGYLIAVTAQHGEELWRFSTGSPIHQKPIAIGPVVYVLPEDGGMFALRPESGEPLWFAEDPVQFVSASPQRIYTLDRFGRLAILDAKTGARIDTLRLPQQIKALANDQTDRLLLYTDGGLIQGLHEAQLTQPHLYLQPKPRVPAKGATTPAPTPPAAGTTPEPMPAVEAAPGG